jgi:hypothetical protein
MTKDEYLEELYKLFMGSDDINDPSGILGYRKLEQKLNVAYNVTHNKMTQEIANQQAALKSATGADKDKIEKHIKDLQADKIKSVKKCQKWKQLKEEIKNDLEENLSDAGLYP